LLFRLDGERAHDLTLAGLDWFEHTGLLRHLAPPRVADPVRLMGLEFPNRVGLAAGLDKAGRHVDALGRLGFGFIETGTVTPRPQAGNPRPRLFRLPQAQALINRFGFNNPGLASFTSNLANTRFKAQGGVLGMNIGKNADTPIEAAHTDYILGLEAVYGLADYVTVNISSPNTRNLRALQSRDELGDLLQHLAEARRRLIDQHSRQVPMLLKIAPDLDDEQIDNIAERVMQAGFEGIIATNTTLSREAISGLPYANETGGLSGAPVREAALRVLERLRRRLGRGPVLVGVGGILRAVDAEAHIGAGADLVQLYTGLIYRGPVLVQECAQALRRLRPVQRSA
jgi:dihydroorotate dehydrogenase